MASNNYYQPRQDYYCRPYSDSSSSSNLTPPNETPYPRPDHSVLQSFSNAFDDLANAESTLHTLQNDYLELENEVRLRMDDYIVARDDAGNWEAKCKKLQAEMEQRESLEGQNRRLMDSLLARGEKVGEIWKNGESIRFVRMRRGRGWGEGGCFGLGCRVRKWWSGSVKRQKALRERWKAWRIKRGEERQRAWDAWHEDY